MSCLVNITNGLFMREVIHDLDEHLFNYFITISEISINIGKFCSPYLILEF